MAKIDELCSRLKWDTSMDDLIDMSEELFKVSEVIERRDEIFFETPISSLKCQKILTYPKKTRAALLYRTSGLYDVAEKSLTDGEREYIRKNYGGVYAENIIKYAGMLYAEADVTYNNARRQFINRPEAWENLNGYRFEVQLSQRRLHKNTEQEIAEIKNKYDFTDSLYRERYFRLIYASRTSGITENNQNEAGHVQTIVRLTKDNYSVFGETETIPLNLDSLEKLPYIEDMRDEEYADLLAKLRAGTFYEERYINAKGKYKIVQKLHIV